jgi:hypothetical protein
MGDELHGYCKSIRLIRKYLQVKNMITSLPFGIINLAFVPSWYSQK